MSAQLQTFQREIGAPDDGGFGPVTFKAGMKHFGWTVAQAAHFYGNTAHETGDYTVFSENLNYSDDTLRRQWPNHFSAMDCIRYARHPEMIANRAYANRMGNGDEASGDGWKYRGRWCDQRTGKDNYAKLAKDLNRPDILNNPDGVEPEMAFTSAIHFFTDNGIWAMCSDVSDATIAKVRHVLNGGFIGLPDVAVRVKRYYSWVA